MPSPQESVNPDQLNYAMALEQARRNDLLAEEQATAEIGGEIEKLEAQAAELSKDASNKYVRIYFILGFCAVVLDILGLIELFIDLGIISGILGFLFAVARWFGFKMADVKKNEQLSRQRAVRTVVSGLAETFPGIDALPLNTVFMFVEWNVKRKRVNAARAQLDGVESQIKSLAAALPK